MRDDAARALRVDDEMPRHRAELRSVSSIDDAYAELRARASERHFERTTPRAAMAAVALEEPVRQSGGAPEAAPAEPARAARSALEEPAREPVSLPRTAPGRAYGAHRRADGLVPARRTTGPQPGR